MENTFFSSTLFFLIVVLVLATIFGIFYLYFTTRNRERMALIEQGLDPNLANSDFWVIVALIAVGMAGGLIIADLLPGGYGPLMGFIVAGINIVVYHFYKLARRKKNMEER
jgi:hypothetical protein